MKKWKLWAGSFFLAIMFCLIPFYGSAAENYAEPFVSDRAGLLSDSEREELEEMAQAATKDYQCGIYIVTVDDYEAYSTESVYEAAKFIYRMNKLGYGDGKDGELLLLSMKERDYSLIAYGYGNTAFTDYGKSVLEKKFLDDFADDEWFDGFEDYINQSAMMLSMSREGNPMDVGYKEPDSAGMKVLGTIMSTFLGLIVTVIVGLILKGQLKSVHEKAEANNYVTQNGIHITTRQDRFINRTTTRRKIEKSNSSGGTHVDSGGFSGSSGKF